MDLQDLTQVFGMKKITVVRRRWHSFLSGVCAAERGVMLQLLLQGIGVVWLLAAPVWGKQPYHTDFASFDPSFWHLDTDCSHCGSRGGDECTQFTNASASFGSGTANGTGVVLHTQHLATGPTHCGASCTSTHLTFSPKVLYGNFTTVARWFGEGTSAAARATATGFIGLDSPGNEASITIGFHGSGWDGDADFGRKFQTALYKDVSKPHHREYVTAPGGRRIDSQANEFTVEWRPDVVRWWLNGVVVRAVTDKAQIPAVAMQLRLHSRSGYCNRLSGDDSFQASVLSFEYKP